MAFRESYTGEEDPGRWFDVSADQERDGKMVQFRIRRVPPDISARLRKRYGKRSGNDYNVTNAKMPLFQRALAASAWTDTNGCFIRCKTEKSAELYARELVQGVVIGEQVCIDGRLTEAVREDILKRDAGLISFIINTATSVEAEEHQDEADYEEHLEGNSSASSSSSSDRTTSQKKDAEPVHSEEAKNHPVSRTAPS